MRNLLFNTYRYHGQLSRNTPGPPISSEQSVIDAMPIKSWLRVFPEVTKGFLRKDAFGSATFARQK